MTTCTELLADYRRLVEKVDALCNHITREHTKDITCHKGCSGCCLHISIFWVEAINLAAALSTMPQDTIAQIRSMAKTAQGSATCPLLHNHICQLYPYRPLICRTHGLPIIVARNGECIVDFCPNNFQETTSLSGNSIIDLERLNTMLAAINALFVKQYFHDAPPATERIPLHEALFLEVNP